MKYAEPLIPIFGEEMVKKMYSKRNWNVRDEGLKMCEDFVKENLNSANPGKVGIFQAALTASGHALDDKIVQVNQRGMSLLQVTLIATEALQVEPGIAQQLVFT